MINYIRHDEQFHGTVKLITGEEILGEVLLTKAKTEPLEKLGWKHSISIKDGIEKCFKELK